METKTQHGYLVLADISGFTSYLAGVELEHAHEILTELLELIVARVKPTLTVTKLEGDAVFAYAPLAHVPRGETLLELIEATYVAFRDRVEAVRRRTTCECNACRNIPTLDLKFIVHLGNYIVQEVAGIRELVGTDVNLAHRLLKNHVSEITGWRAYALFSEPALMQLNLVPEGLHAQTETYDLGEVRTCTFDLHPRYQALVEARRVFIEPERAHFNASLDCSAPPPVVWDWLNMPERRTLWEHNNVKPTIRPSGRTMSGARNHCVHGKNQQMIETVLDWRPFDYFTVEKDVRETVRSVITITTCLQPTNGGSGTRLVITGRMHMPLPDFVIRLMSPLALKMFGVYEHYANLKRLVDQDAAQT